MFEHIKKYPECPMRNEALNCGVHGGFCVDAVSDEICDVLHNAYELGYSHGYDKGFRCGVDAGQEAQWASEHI